MYNIERDDYNELFLTFLNENGYDINFRETPKDLRGNICHWVNYDKRGNYVLISVNVLGHLMVSNYLDAYDFLKLSELAKEWEKYADKVNE